MTQIVLHRTDHADAIPSGGKRFDRVLDAAEELFALHGFDGVTMRQIAKLAQVDVALPNYHFGSKQGLFDAVFHRRAALFNAARSEQLDKVAADAGAAPPQLEAIMAAFLMPIAEAQLQSDPGWRNYCRLVAQVNSSPVWVQMMTEHYDALIRKFVDLVARALPDTPRTDLFWGYHFLSGALSLSMADTGRIQHLSDGLCRSDDYGTLYRHMIQFFANGFRGIKAHG